VIVGDSSVAVAIVTNDRPTALRLWKRIDDHTVHAPHLLELEVANALRRIVLRRKLDVEAGESALLDLSRLAIVRHPHEPLMRRVWELRENLTAYDASYVALAEALGAPLLTTDARLARASGTACEIELFA
jgi:predicted nucleic acid-binding protein